MDGKAQYDKAPPRAQLFIDYHVGGMSQTDAYRKAGYTGKSPFAPGQLAHKRREAIAYRKAEIRDDTETQRQESVDRLTGYATGNLADLFPDGLEMSPEAWRALPREVKRLVSEVTFEQRHTEDGTLIEKVKLKLEARAVVEAQLAKLQGWNRPAEIKVKGDGLLSDKAAGVLGPIFDKLGR